MPRLYLDPNRAFGGMLNDADERLAYYRQVIAAAEAEAPSARRRPLWRQLLAKRCGGEPVTVPRARRRATVRSSPSRPLPMSGNVILANRRLFGVPRRAARSRLGPNCGATPARPR